MTARPPKAPVGAPAALSAFLRGVERRAAVFAHLQVGDAGVGMRALSGAMAAFCGEAVHIPFADWSRCFWAQLLATPLLREPPPSAHWPQDFEALGMTGQGSRAALLLRLVAHVSEADAAAVLGVSRPTYRLALHRALPRGEGGAADEALWRALGDAAQQAVRNLAPVQLAELGQLREAALQGRDWAPAPPPSVSAPAPARARWVWPATLGVVAVVLLAMLASFHPAALVPGFDPDAGPDHVQSEALSPLQVPAAAWDEDFLLLTHPDFEQLAAGDEDAAMRDPAFHAWLVHRVDAVPDSDIVRAEREETAADVEAESPEFDDVP